MTIIRTAFWLTIIVFLLPTGKKGDVEHDSKVSLNSAVSAATQTAGDLAGFCQRNPDVCATGKAAMHDFGVKAKYGAQKVMEWAASPSVTKTKTEPKAKIEPSASEITHSIGKQADASSAIASKQDRNMKSDRLPVQVRQQGRTRMPSQNTLTREDLAPALKSPKSA